MRVLTYIDEQIIPSERNIGSNSKVVTPEILF